MTTSMNGALAIGRTIRTIVGVIVILADVGAFCVSNVVLPIMTRERATFEVKELALHAVFLGLGVLLFNKDTGLAIVDRILDKVPFGRS